jgi:hypothetical protein
LLGALLGVKALPGEWLRDLELRDVVEVVATDLYEFPEWRRELVAEGNPHERIWTKYPGN